MAKFFILRLFLFAFCLFGRQVQQIGFSQNNFTIAVDSCKALHADSSFFSFLSPENLSCLEGVDLPSFSAQTLDQQQLQIPGSKAQVHVLYFWHLSCDPCLGLMAGLDNLQQKFQYQSVRFLSFTTDDQASIVEEFFPYYTFIWPIVSDAFTLNKETFAFSWGYPTLMIFDTNNKLAYIEAGAVNEPAVIQKIIEDLTSEIEHCLKK